MQELDDARRDVGRKRHESRPAPRQAGRGVVRPPRRRGRRRNSSDLSRSGRQGLADRRGLTRRPRARARGPGGFGDDQHAGIRGSAVRGLARRIRRGADQRQAAPTGVRLHPGRLGSEGLHRDRGSGGGDRGPRERSSGAPGGSGRRRDGLRQALRRRGLTDGGGRAGRPRLAVLHQRHDGTPQGRDAQPPQPADHDVELLRRCRPGRRGQHDRPCRADVARLGPLPVAAYRQRRVPGDPREQGFQRRRISGFAPLLHRCYGVLRADHGDPAGQRPLARLRRPHQSSDHRLWRRTDVRRRLLARAGRDRPVPGPDLWPGRIAHDHHRAVARGASRPRSSALYGTSGLGRHPAHRCRGAGLRRP